jgi:hypothetical protein
MEGDFSIELESLVEADANTGYSYVTRAADGKRKLVLSIPCPLNMWSSFLVFVFYILWLAGNSPPAAYAFSPWILHQQDTGL